MSAIDDVRIDADGAMHYEPERDLQCHDDGPDAERPVGLLTHVSVEYGSITLMGPSADEWADVSLGVLEASEDQRDPLTYDCAVCGCDVRYSDLAVPEDGEPRCPEHERTVILE